MSNGRMALILSVMACFLAGAVAVSSGEGIPPRAPETSPETSKHNEQTFWNLERAYWRYVQDNDLPAYIAQWHKDFVGWPSVSPAPVRKDHITDWMTSQTSKGLTFKPGELKPAALQITGDVAVAYYWMTYQWLAKDGTEKTYTIRVTHTWIKDGKDWKIIGGMSAAEPAPQQK